MEILKKPISIVEVEGDPKKKVLKFADEKYTKTFGYEWTNYSRTYSDSALETNLSKSRLELNLGFPLEFLKGMNVLELGCGAGRFTEQLAREARHVVAVDLSEAVYSNVALGLPNVTFLQADILDIPKMSEPIDLVFCRGVVQHTQYPDKTLKRFFDYVRDDGFVIFDVYKKHSNDWRSFKYFWRPFFQKYISVEEFDSCIKKHDKRLYAFHHAFLKIFNLPLIRRIMQATPLYLSMNWEKQYPHLSKIQRLEIFKNELIDMLYSHYDQPMTPDEVIQMLAEIGQIPYSYDTERNHFRYKKNKNKSPLKVRRTKNGVFAIKAQ
ncbi:class I SAM-dependent methyltransferase [bacterium]|nr:class I SAM-dependent methyltransferase [bacterium]